MKTLAILILLFSTIAHAAPTFKEKWKAVEADRKKPGYKEFETAFLKAAGNELQGFSAGCIKKKGEVKGVLEIGQAGDLAEIYTSAPDAETKCLASKIVGFMSSPPPFTPLHLGVKLVH